MALSEWTKRVADGGERSVSPTIDFVLRRLRRRIRSYIWVDGLARVLGALTVWLLASQAIDRFEPPWWVRGALLVAGVGAVGYVAWRWLIDRLTTPLSARSLALLIERRFDRFGEGLVTVVELSDRAGEDDDIDPAMFEAVRELADRRISGVDLDELFDRRSRNRSVSIALALSVALMATAVVWPQHFQIWLRRTVAFSNELYPRNTRLRVEGFENGVAKVARGADLEIVALADTSMRVPRYVQLRYTTDDGKQGRRTMSREGDARADGEPMQRYSYTFEGVLDSFELELLGGDARVRDLRVEVVEAPTLAEVRLACRFPDYLGRSPRELPVTGVMQLPQGTRVTLRGQANKPLVEARLEMPENDETLPTVYTVRLDENGDRRHVVFDLGVLDRDRVLLIHLLDTDGIRSLEPIRVVVLATADQPPVASAFPRGISTAVTPRARVPFEGQLRDDYALADAWFEYRVDDGPHQRRPLESPFPASDTYEVDAVFEVQPLGLEPGQTLTLTIQARDRRRLGDEGPQIGSTQRFTLDVVTPEALLARLETRELNLRRRFETLIDELTDTRDSIGRLESLHHSDKNSGPADTSAGADASRVDGRKPLSSSERGPEATVAEIGGAETGGDEAANSATTSGDRQRAARSLDRLRVERAIQNTRKNANEVRGLAEAFDDIYAELINNRIDTEELKTRIKVGISQRLWHIGDHMLPGLATRLETLKQQLDDAAAKQTHTEAVRLADETLVAMQGVLAKMLELETFNEVVDLLRSIIESQQKVHEKTQQRRKSDLRDLLE